MTSGHWLSVLARQGFAIGWDEILVGHDFGILPPAEIQAWAANLPGRGPSAEALAGLTGPALLTFEAALWAAVREATGKVPRPGGRRWAQAQDHWRTALLQDALAAPLGAEALALAVETIYELVGCPEDMLGLWTRSAPWEKRPAQAHPEAIQAFLRDRGGVRQP
ncbi:hypothetical protein [Mesoterricola sediminis]|uniref:Uncharacterized protein n=1 Tax=Mesoterricola sediminis TaxID=2927980 RepID=A0AA48GST6_9BACT|nr:hypothetical protein [Mesoterricola sediminis]BDU76947.1 hypothetical protein METESE_19050 [Mesoterricola sediminis]